MRAFGVIGAALGALSASACATSAGSIASVPEPQLRLETYFEGRTQAWGVFRDRGGNLRRQFTVTIDGDWNGETLTLDEHFLYSDGATERRVWTIRPTGPDTYEGTAADVEGVALGQVQGNTLLWNYDLNLRVGERTWTVDFDDRMYLQPDGVLINHAIVRKYGVRVGEAMIVFQRVSETQAGVERPSVAVAAE
jgi:Protein of unknown function (DUF3833)